MKPGLALVGFVTASGCAGTLAQSMRSRSLRTGFLFALQRALIAVANASRDSFQALAGCSRSACAGRPRRRDGWAMGTLVVDGERYLVVRHEAASRLVRL